MTYLPSEILQNAAVTGKRIELTDTVVSATDLIIKQFDEDLLKALIATVLVGAPDEIVGEDATRLITEAFRKAADINAADLFDLNQDTMLVVLETADDPIPF